MEPEHLGLLLGQAGQAGPHQAHQLRGPRFLHGAAVGGGRLGDLLQREEGGPCPQARPEPVDGSARRQGRQQRGPVLDLLPPGKPEGGEEGFLVAVQGVGVVVEHPVDRPPHFGAVLGQDRAPLGHPVLLALYPFSRPRGGRRYTVFAPVSGPALPLSRSGPGAGATADRRGRLVRRKGSPTALLCQGTKGEESGARGWDGRQSGRFGRPGGTLRKSRKNLACLRLSQRRGVVAKLASCL
jgi:hypothetical protein